MLSVDLRKAFDVVDHRILLRKIAETTLHPNVKRWLVAYLRDRKARCSYQGMLSSWKKVKMGVPQGGVLSPNLFNFNVKDVSSESADEDKSFADDFHSLFSDVDVEEITEAITAATAELVDSAAACGMELSIPKSTTTLFTPWNKEFGGLPPISLDESVGDDGDDEEVEKEEIKAAQNPTLLGVTFDPTLCFHKHAAATARKAAARVNIIRALAHTSFGKDKECLIETFKQLVRPIFDYAAPIVFPNYSAKSIELLQKIQNRCLRLATGCHAAAAIDHLHAETAVLPVGDHLHLLSSQYLARALQSHHPSNDVVNVDRGPRACKQTLRSKCLADVEPYLTDGVMRVGDYKRAIDGIHTKVVSDAIDRHEPNHVLDARPPLVHPSEKYLPREIRTTMSRLRDGHCINLNDFRHRIGRSDTDLCPECNLSTHTTQHLFDCPNFPTNLVTTDLWDRPWDAAVFLSSLPTFDFFPHPGPPPPPRPRPRPRNRQRRRPPPEPPPQP